MQTCANTSLSQDFVGQTGPKPNDPPWYPVKTLAFAFALQRSASLSQTFRSSQRVCSKPVWFYSRLSRCIVFDRILLATKLLFTYTIYIPKKDPKTIWLVAKLWPASIPGLLSLFGHVMPSVWDQPPTKRAGQQERHDDMCTIWPVPASRSQQCRQKR